MRSISWNTFSRFCSVVGEPLSVSCIRAILQFTFSQVEHIDFPICMWTWTFTKAFRAHKQHYDIDASVKYSMASSKRPLEFISSWKCELYHQWWKFVFLINSLKFIKSWDKTKKRALDMMCNSIYKKMSTKLWWNEKRGKVGVCIFPVNWTWLQKISAKKILFRDKNFSATRKQLSLSTAQWVESKRFAIN